MWIARCSESETGFLLGWPSPARTYLVTFCTQAARESWWREVRQSLFTQLRLEPSDTNIKVKSQYIFINMMNNIEIFFRLSIEIQ